ncbi:hypothetical protein KKD81_02870 [Patescibacteria group bacterium]|nr:hypothetical protein [Patescibacteria group bacterium]MBU2159102.1 hypothetical protein [Patescibacteria group bacterium]MBU2220853.1 hypothetical protein [Patescibacteria group bacterium]
MTAYIALAAAFVLNAIANILLKIGSERGILLQGPVGTLLAHNWAFLVGVGLFAANVLFYFLALRSLPLSTAYPVMVAMSFIIINSYAFLVFREPLTVLQAFGYVCIVVGLALVVTQSA